MEGGYRLQTIRSLEIPPNFGFYYFKNVHSTNTCIKFLIVYVVLESNSLKA